jgi:polyvinyl alcohol dehydrogenase (cytochrome)
MLAVLAAGVALAAPCAGPPSKPGDAAWNGWADFGNTRFQSAQAAGLTAKNTPKLKLKWAFGFPNATTAQGTPTIFGGRVFVGDANGVVYSLDAGSGCTYWTFTAAAGVRVSPVLDAGGGFVYFGDLKGNVYALDASSGKQLWKVRADDHPMAVITGSPKLTGGRLYVPVSGRDESMAATDPKYECCTFRGSLVALDAANGRKVWQAYTISDQPQVTGKNASGTKQWGPSGAVPWSSPTIDMQERLIYIGTGVNYSKPATDTSDAIIAISMDNGDIVWSSQLTSGDAYNFACGAAEANARANCPLTPFVDTDLGNSGILRSLAGRRVLVTSDKGGTVYGLDPGQQGRIIWKQKIANGGVNGGTMWGGASDDRGMVYFSVSDFAAGKPEAGGGLVALQMTTGEKFWTTPAPKPTCLALKGCSAAQPAPVSVIPGVAFLGSSDGHLRAYETTVGKIIWDVDTAKDFDTVNGVKAHGGSINSMGAAIVGGMVYITSGYGGNGMPGNVLLAFGL